MRNGWVVALKGILAAGMLATQGGVATAQIVGPMADALSLELNKVETTDKGCLATFVLGNGFPAQIDWLDVRLVLFDKQGVVAERMQISLGPLPAGRRTLAGFVMAERNCADIGSLMVEDVPNCQGLASPGGCFNLLNLANRTDLPFGK